MEVLRQLHIIKFPDKLIKFATLFKWLPLLSKCENVFLYSMHMNGENESGHETDKRLCLFMTSAD